VTVDGTDFRTERQTGQGKSWYSHKFHGPGLRYEVGVSILDGNIVWLNGPFPCGDWPDITIFRLSLMKFLDYGERVEADDGYIGESPKFIKCPKKDTIVCDAQKKLKSRIRSRHETVNQRFKQFAILRDVFRHDISIHGDVFRACMTLVQLQIEDGEPLFRTNDYLDINFE